MAEVNPTMNPRETLAALAELLAKDTTLSVCTVAKGAKAADPPEARVVKLAGDAEQRFRGIIDGAVTAKLDPLKWILRKLDPVYKPEAGGEEVEWIKTETVGPVSQATDRLDKFSGFAGFDTSDEGYLRRLQYWGARIGVGEDQAYFFRRFTSSAELKHKNKVAMVLKSGTLHTVQDRIFLFDNEVDCVVYGDYVFVLRKADFRKMFEQMKAVFKKARTAAADLHAKLPISNFEDFQDACSSDSRLADKIIAIRQRDYFDELSYSLVEPVMQEFDVDIPTKKGKAGKVELEFRTGPADRFRILRLCDDDYLRSTMTKRRYEVNSKTDRGS